MWTTGWTTCIESAVIVHSAWVLQKVTKILSYAAVTKRTEDDSIRECRVVVLVRQTSWTVCALKLIIRKWKNAFTNFGFWGK